MRSNIRLWLWIAAALFCSGCAAHELPAPTINAAHKIGVISGFGNEILMARSGITVFSDSLSKGSIPEWKVDEVVINRVRADLSPGREVVAWTVDPGQLGSMVKNGFGIDPQIVPPSKEHADLWILVSSKCPVSQNATSGAIYSDVVPCGVAVSHPETMFGPPNAWIVLQGQIEVFDGVTLKRIAQSDILLDKQCGPFSNADMFSFARDGCEPGIELGKYYAVDSWQDYTASQKEFIHGKLLQFLEPSMDFTLRRLKLLK